MGEVRDDGVAGRIDLLAASVEAVLEGLSLGETTREQEGRLWRGLQDRKLRGIGGDDGR